MDRDKIDELLEARKQADEELEKMRTAVTILFSDIKGSTEYFERKGDLEGLAMVQRHNKLLIPIVETEGGRVVKTIGDSIMACFLDPVCAIKAAIGMQRTLDEDRGNQPEDEQIHIRLGLHTGIGLEKDGDVYGDVVNSAARVQHLAQPDQILITDVLLDAAETAGAQCLNLGLAEVKGKEEPIEIYAVAWSTLAKEQLIRELAAQYEKKLKDARRQYDELEEEYENAREQWRNDRRKLTAEIEAIEEKVGQAKTGARQSVLDDLQAEMRVQLEDAVRARQQVEQELIAAQAKWEVERDRLKEQIVTMQGAALEAMERSNNPARITMAVREQVDARLKEARQDWQLEWEGERRRLNAEIDRLKKTGSVDDKKEAARRAVLHKMGKLPASEAPKTPSQWQQEIDDATIAWQTERSQLELKAERLQREAQRGREEIRSEISQELRAQYESTVARAEMEKKRVEAELEAVKSEADEERRRLVATIEQLEQSGPEMLEAVRAQATAELQSEFEAKIDEFTRTKARAERRLQDDAEEAGLEMRRLKKQNARLEEEIKKARESSFRNQRSGALSDDEETE